MGEWGVREIFWIGMLHRVIDSRDKLGEHVSEWSLEVWFCNRTIYFLLSYMYWTDWGIPKIERAYMDGSSRSVLVSKTIRWPNGLTIDHVYNKLYWADAFEDSIEIYDLETGERDVIINEKFFFRK